MTTDSEPRVVVTQEDREAAKSLLGRDDAGPSWWSIDSGNADDDFMVQAFARHRIATEDACRAREEELMDGLRWYADTFCEGLGECVGDFCGKCSDDQCSGCKAYALLATRP